MNPKVEAFYDKADAWREEMLALYAILADTELAVE